LYLLLQGAYKQKVVSIKVHTKYIFVALYDACNRECDYFYYFSIQVCYKNTVRNRCDINHVTTTIKHCIAHLLENVSMHCDSKMRVSRNLDLLENTKGASEFKSLIK
jgi:hypothetical protein